MAKALLIEVVPVATVVSHGRTYTDGVDLTPSLVEKIMEEEPGRFRTSAIPPSYFVNTFERLSRESSDILVVTLSSRLSAVYNSAVMASEQLAKEKPGIRIRVLDSLSASGGEGLIALAAAKAAAKGLSVDETLAVAEKARERVLCMFVFDTTRYVYRTGRVPRVVGEAADKLGVKPVCKLGKDGRVHFVMIARSRKKGVQYIMDALHNWAANRPVDAAVLHSAAEADAQELKSRIVAEFTCETVFVSEFSQVMSYATGPGVLGAAVLPVV